MRGEEDCNVDLRGAPAYTPRFVSIIHKLLNAESEWNPKVIVGRVVTTLLPERVAITLIDVGGWRIDGANLR